MKITVRLSAAILAVYMVTNMCSAQTSAVSAKQHYQNAQNAIKAGDYDVAANELRTAARFAPRNALIWYDLGIVLSKEHHDTEARQALKKALRLGLPAKEKARTNALLADLNKGPDEDGATDPNESAVRSQSSADSNATLGTTINFLKSKIEGSSATGTAEVEVSGCMATFQQSFTYGVFDADSCSIHLKETVSSSASALGNCSVNGGSPIVYDARLSLQRVALGSSKTEERNAATVIAAAAWKVPLYQVALAFNEPVTYSTNGNSDTTKIWYFIVQDREMADRLLRAFTHAAELCGARQEAF